MGTSPPFHFSRIYPFRYFPHSPAFHTSSSPVFSSTFNLFQSNSTLFHDLCLVTPWKERKRRRNTLYVLTEHRLMTIIDHSIRTYSVHKIKGIRHRLRKNGSGDIMLKYGKKRGFQFKDIMNAREAVDILKGLRTTQPTPERER